MSRTQWDTYEQSISLVKQDGGGQSPKKPLGRPSQALAPTRGSPLVAAPICPGPTAAPHLPSPKAHSGSAGPSCGCQGEVSDAYFGFSPETLLPEGQDGLVSRVRAAGTPGHCALAPCTSDEVRILKTSRASSRLDAGGFPGV